jgi:hypothetical protein
MVLKEGGNALPLHTQELARVSLTAFMQETGLAPDILELSISVQKA